MKRSRSDDPEAVAELESQAVVDFGPLSPEEELEAKRLAEIAAKGWLLSREIFKYKIKD